MGAACLGSPTGQIWLLGFVLGPERSEYAGCFLDPAQQWETEELNSTSAQARVGACEGGQVAWGPWEATPVLEPGAVLRFLDHVRNEDSPGPPIGSHHAFFSDEDLESQPVTDIANLIQDSYEVCGPGPRPLQVQEVDLGEAVLASRSVFGEWVTPVSLQKFGDPSVEQIEHLRCKHRIRVLQGHEDITKQNVVSGPGLRGQEQDWTGVGQASTGASPFPSSAVRPCSGSVCRASEEPPAPRSVRAGAWSLH